MTGQGSTADTAHRGLPKYLVDAAQRVSCLDDPATLRLLMHKFSLEPGAVMETPVATSQRGVLVRLMDGLCRRPGGLTPLVEALEVIDGDTVAVRDLKVAAAVWEVDLLSPEEWEELFRLLDGVRVPNLRQWYAEFLQERPHVVPPAQCTEPWAAFLHAATLNARPGKSLPCFQLLRRLAFAADGERQLAIIDWADVHDPHPSADDEAGPLAAARLSVDDTDVWSPTDYLIIRLRPLLDCGVASLTILSHWWRVHPGGQLRGADRRIELDQAEREVRNLIREAESEWAYCVKSELAIEFVLPWELLHLRVERWCKCALRGTGAVLGERHPVVVRSLDRLERRDLHGCWGNRWDAFSEGRAGRVHWFPEDGVAHLLSDPPPAVVVLSSPPSDTNELGEALIAGVPVVVWDRRGGRDPAFRAALREVLRSNDPRRFPGVVKTLRITSRDGDSEGDLVVGRHIALLWDDPNRLPVAPSDSDGPGHGRSGEERNT
ncbi:VMAP-C domain-containing protein [Streptomyces sp. SAS_270]|uniref:VMAP-C domain-containing protein n=1 Tax=Streptomyces sp. SAS_270 TaxID=3412748 RepID=UPI00403C3346